MMDISWGFWRLWCLILTEAELSTLPVCLAKRIKACLWCNFESFYATAPLTAGLHLLVQINKGLHLSPGFTRSVYLDEIRWKLNDPQGEIRSSLQHIIHHGQFYCVENKRGKKNKMAEWMFVLSLTLVYMFKIIKLNFYITQHNHGSCRYTFRLTLASPGGSEGQWPSDV